MKAAGKGVVDPAAQEAKGVSPHVRTEQIQPFDENDLSLAEYLGIDLNIDPSEQLQQAAQAYNAATISMMKAGLRLAKVRHEVGAEPFAAMVEKLGLAKQRASELIRGAQFAARLPEAQRKRMLALPKYKVLALANADAVVVEAMLEDGEFNADFLSVRELRRQIVKLEIALETARSDRDQLKAKQDAAPGTRSDGWPSSVVFVHEELDALADKALLAVRSFGHVLSQLEPLRDDNATHDWADGTLRMAAGHLGIIASEAYALLEACTEQLPGRELILTPLTLPSRQLVADAVKIWNAAIGEHKQEVDGRRIKHAQRVDEALPVGQRKRGRKPNALKALKDSA